MNKNILIGFVFLIMLVSLVSAGDRIVNIPDDVTSFEEWKQRVIDANDGRGYFAVAVNDYWGICDQECWEFNFFGDCNACDSGEVASMCTWHPDYMSYLEPWSSAYAYCNDWLKPFTYYNKQCYCSVPTTQCSGGADPGDRKCEGRDIFICSNSGVWEFDTTCTYECAGGECQEQQCTPHVTKKCEGDSVYWFDSCGNREQEYERCSSDEKCENAQCVRYCEERYIGSALCSGKEIVQQYQLEDCSTEIRTKQVCDYQCQNAVCINPQCGTCPDPTAWSQCVEGKMFRTNYQCDSTTGYDCKAFNEEQSCECGTSNQCDYDEICNDNVCIELTCEEDEIADNHQCIKKQTFPLWGYIAIGIGFLILIMIFVIIMVLIKTKKGGKR